MAANCEMSGSRCTLVVALSGDCSSPVHQTNRQHVLWSNACGRAHSPPTVRSNTPGSPLSSLHPTTNRFHHPLSPSTNLSLPSPSNVPCKPPCWSLNCAYAWVRAARRALSSSGRVVGGGAESVAEAAEAERGCLGCRGRSIVYGGR